MSNKEQHWAKTKGLLFVTLAIWFVFSIGIFFFGAEMEASSFKPLGYPLSYYMTCQGSLGIFVILIFWFAGRQEKIDEEFGFSSQLASFFLELKWRLLTSSHLDILYHTI